MKSQLLIKIATVVAFTGLMLVVGVLISKIFIDLTLSTKNTVLVVGFTLMLLGTLWKVVLEMNSPEDQN